MSATIGPLQFDALNRLRGVLENGTTTLADYDYDAASRRTDLGYGDSSSASYGYAANDDLTGLTQSFTGSSVTFSYGYNNVGQRTSVNVSDGSFLYHPPAASSVSYAPNGVNQYATVGSASLTYDTENHLVSASESAGAYTYTTKDQTNGVSSGLAMPRTLVGGKPTWVTASHGPGIEPCCAPGNRRVDA